ncbi:LysR family transcriptional regulator [Rhizobium sp. CCGE 510]|nr:LysR family transcriptional regulator [Rhizobium sp. CCGE 510]
MMIRIACAGAGITFGMVETFEACIERGKLVPLLEDFCPLFQGFTSKSQAPAPAAEAAGAGGASSHLRQAADRVGHPRLISADCLRFPGPSHSLRLGLPWPCGQSPDLATQAVGERGKNIGELRRGFRRRQRYLQASRTGGRIALYPWMRRRIGIVGRLQSGDNLCADLGQGLPRIGSGMAGRGGGFGWRHHLRSRVGLDIRFEIFRGSRLAGGDEVRHLLGRRHGLAFTHAPGDVLHFLHEPGET